jgi:hypothetical protein
VGRIQALLEIHGLEAECRRKEGRPAVEHPRAAAGAVDEEE